MASPKVRLRFRLRTILIAIAVLAPVLAMSIHVYRMSQAFDAYYFPKGKPIHRAAGVPAPGGLAR
jgi:hypothetical protein